MDIRTSILYFRSGLFFHTLLQVGSLHRCQSIACRQTAALRFQKALLDLHSPNEACYSLFLESIICHLTIMQNLFLKCVIYTPNYSGTVGKAFNNAGLTTARRTNSQELPSMLFRKAAFLTENESTLSADMKISQQMALWSLFHCASASVSDTYLYLFHHTSC